MFDDAQREFLLARHFAVVATINEDGTPHLTTVWYLLDGQDLVFNTAAGRVKHRNLCRDPRLAATILSEDGYRYMTASGSARLDTGTGQETIYRLAERYSGETAAREQMRTQFSHEERVTIRLAVARPIVYGF